MAEQGVQFVIADFLVELFEVNLKNCRAIVIGCLSILRFEFNLLHTSLKGFPLTLNNYGSALREFRIMTARMDHEPGSRLGCVGQPASYIKNRVSSQSAPVGCDSVLPVPFD